MSPITERGRDAALAALVNRRKNRPEKINNSSLPVGFDMYYYCKSCGHLSCVLPESWTSGYKKFCDECQALIDLGWME